MVEPADDVETLIIFILKFLWEMQLVVEGLVVAFLDKDTKNPQDSSKVAILYMILDVDNQALYKKRTKSFEGGYNYLLCPRLMMKRRSL
jgi:hypothetical protein